MPRSSQRGSRRSKRGTGGGHVVDQQDSPLCGRPPAQCLEAWALYSTSEISRCLGAMIDPAQKRYRPKTQPTGHRSREQFALIEAAPAATLGRGRHPCDEVTRWTNGAQLCGKMTHDRCGSPVFQSTYQVRGIAFVDPPRDSGVNSGDMKLNRTNQFRHGRNVCAGYDKFPRRSPSTMRPGISVTRLAYSPWQ